MLEDAALFSRAADLGAESESEPWVCPDCGTAMQARGTQTRALVTQHDQLLHLERSYTVCPHCQKGFFSLDEELQLLPGHLTLSLQEHLTSSST